MAKFTFDEAAIDQSIQNLDNTLYLVKDSAAKLSTFWNTEMREAISDDVRSEWDEHFRSAHKYCSTDLENLINQFKQILNSAKEVYIQAKQQYLNSSEYKEGTARERENYQNASTTAEQGRHPNGIY